ncbi:MAG: hypothetical protein AAF297_10820 [Planctomycetota bacterium]
MAKNGFGMWLTVGVIGGMAATAAAGPAGEVLVVEDSFNGLGGIVRGGLEAAGYTVTEVGALPVALDGFTQVWDVRARGAISDAEEAAFAAYLADGGRMFLTGENNGQSFRNLTVRQLLEEAGSGQTGVQNTSWSGDQDVTAAGGFVFDYASMTFDSSSLWTSVGSGALLTERSDATGTGSIAGWGVGTLGSALDGAVIAALDTNFLFRDHARTTGDTVAMIAAALDAGGVVPAPGAAMLAGVGLVASARRRR